MNMSMGMGMGMGTGARVSTLSGEEQVQCYGRRRSSRPDDEESRYGERCCNLAQHGVARQIAKTNGLEYQQRLPDRLRILLKDLRQ